MAAADSPGAEQWRVHLDWSEQGSLEHYWHYLLGVILPLADLYRRNPGRLRDARLLLDSCGPVMDSVITGPGLDLAVEIVDGPPRIRREPMWRFRLHAMLRRWRHALRLSPSWRPKLEAPVIRLPRWDAYLRRHGSADVEFTEALAAVAKLMADLARDRGCCRSGSEGVYLLLRRSDPPPYFAPGGPAGRGAYGRYGSARRTLQGLEVCRDTLAEAGVASVIYEPGAHDLACQMRQFASARGIVGIRGAEFANMVWASPAALVLMIAYDRMDHAPQRALAKAMGLCHYRELDCGPGETPTLDVHATVNIIKAHRAALAVNPGLSRA
jgi:hypothetical protein